MRWAGFHYLHAVLICIFCLIGRVSDAIEKQNGEQWPHASSKADKLLELIDRPSQEVRDELYLVTRHIEDHWDEWIQSPRNAAGSTYEHQQVTESSYLTIHPEVPEVCIFLHGHTQELGRGAFKRVVKALTYAGEQEVAVAIPHAVEVEAAALSAAVLSQSNVDVNEADVLQAVQGCRGVIRVHFIAFHWSDAYQRLLPIIVSDYYNGGTLSSFYRDTSSATMEECLMVCHDILLGVCEIQSRLVVHDSLGWSNIMLDRDRLTGRVSGAYIIDFGCSKKMISKGIGYNDDSGHAYFAAYEMLSRIEGGATLQAYIKWAFDNRIPSTEGYAGFVDMLTAVVGCECARRITAPSRI